MSGEPSPVLPRADPGPELSTAIAHEFRRLPTLALTAAQARRLWSLEPGICTQLLERLVEDGVLARRDDGRYVVRAGASGALPA
jgi:hypothetical protein